jgi:hypothetical protein
MTQVFSTVQLPGAEDAIDSDLAEKTVCEGENECIRFVEAATYMDLPPREPPPLLWNQLLFLHDLHHYNSSS